MAKRQASLSEFCGPSKKGKGMSGEYTVAEQSSSDAPSTNSFQQESEKVACMEETTDDEGETVSSCTALCCMDSKETYQPTNKQDLFQLSQKERNFQPQWYKQFPWITILTTNYNAMSQILNLHMCRLIVVLIRANQSVLMMFHSLFRIINSVLYLFTPLLTSQ